MKTLRVVYTSIICLLWACQNQAKHSLLQIPVKGSAEFHVRRNPDTVKPLTNKKQLLGQWQSMNDKESLTVNISSHTIRYIEHRESYTYRVKGDSIFVNYPGFVYKAKVFFEADTLFFQSEDGKAAYVRK